LLLGDWLHSWSSGGEENCILYHLFFTFIIIIIIIIITPSFVVLLNCLYFNPQVLPFVHSSAHPTKGVGGLSEQLSGVYLPSARLNHDTEISQSSESVKYPWNNSASMAAICGSNPASI